jgi:hypothetical protein
MHIDILTAEIRKIKREKKKGTTSMKEERESVQPLQGRVLMTEKGRRSRRKTILQLK